MIASFIQNTSTVTYALGAFQKFSYFFVRFESLELLVRVQVRILVVETNNHSDENFVRTHVVHKRACIDV
jgi:hypothetical protein